MRCSLVLGTTLAATLGAPSIGIAQSSPAEYSIREGRSSSSIVLRNPEVVTGSPIPINKRYRELTAAEKSIIHGWYENIEPDDEPPFPADGLRSIYVAVAKAQARLLVTGTLLLVATVGADGEVTSVKAVGSPSPEMTQFASGVLILTKFKPALCKGVPCTMDYPFMYDFKVR